MAHRTTIIDTKRVANDATAVLVRCCDDPATDSWHTIHWIAVKSPSDIDAEITRHAARVAQTHTGCLAADGHMQNIMGSVIEHTDESIAAALAVGVKDGVNDKRPPGAP